MSLNSTIMTRLDEGAPARYSRVRRCGSAALGLLLLLLLVPQSAGADPRGAGAASYLVDARGGEVHLRLLRSEPAADSTVRTAPTELRLWFSQRPELSLTSARISMGNHTVATGRAALRSSEGEGVLVVLPISGRLEDGRHTVAWRTMAPDGHIMNGEFSFTLASSGRAPGI